jgi:glycerol uptake facilitator-like aquaporin
VFARPLFVEGLYSADMKKVIGEFLGTATLVAIVVGSGIMATNLSEDIGVQLLINTISTVFGLAVLIQVLGPISGANFNPVVTMVDLIQKRTNFVTFIQYVFAQTAGAITGAVLANAMFSHPLYEISAKVRSGGNQYLGEIVATAGLILIINLMIHQEKTGLIPVIVASWIGSAYFFTSSTSFANPAVTVGRIFSDSFAGIAPGCVSKFIAAQILGAIIGLGLTKVLTHDK